MAHALKCSHDPLYEPTLDELCCGQTAINTATGCIYVKFCDENGIEKIIKNCPADVPLPGCPDPEAKNFNPDANINDGSCIYPDDFPDEQKVQDPTDVPITPETIDQLCPPVFCAPEEDLETGDIPPGGGGPYGSGSSSPAPPGGGGSGDDCVICVCSCPTGDAGASCPWDLGTRSLGSSDYVLTSDMASGTSGVCGWHSAVSGDFDLVCDVDPDGNSVCFNTLTFTIGLLTGSTGCGSGTDPACA
jgi:hypothetical protein